MVVEMLVPIAGAVEMVLTTQHPHNTTILSPLFLSFSAGLFQEGGQAGEEEEEEEEMEEEEEEEKKKGEREEHR